MSDAESRSFFSVAMKKFPLAKLRSEIAIIKPLFVESYDKKVEEGLSNALKNDATFIPSYIHTIVR